MMHTKIKLSLYILLLVFAFSSCSKDFVDITPKGKLIASKTEDYDLLMNSSTFYQYLSGGGWQAPVLMGDDIGAESVYFTTASPQTQRLFRWEDVIYDQVTDVPSDLRLFLPNIYTCNLIIDEVLKSAGGTEQQKKSLQAEALATRAWIYFQLVNLYARPYNESSADTDPGFPVITRPEATATNFQRGSVKETYNFIISDLNAAIENLPVQNVIRTRMSKPAAQALLGKVWLFMQRPDQALPLFNAAIQNNNTSSAPAVLYDYNVTFAPGGAFLPLGNNGPASPGNNYNDFTENLLARTFGNPYSYGNNGIVITNETKALFAPTDWRLRFYTNTYINNTPLTGGRLRKYGVSYTKFGVTLPELYLLRAEANARLNNLAAAREDLEVLRKKRMPAADAEIPAGIAANQAELIKYIFDERTREFAAEGYRWFDMRRMSVDPIFQGITFTHKLYSAGGDPMVYKLRLPDRLTLRLPPNIMAANPGMEDNP